jgi:hypothetical protein
MQNSFKEIEENDRIWNLFHVNLWKKNAKNESAVLTFSGQGVGRNVSNDVLTRLT